PEIAGDRDWRFAGAVPEKDVACGGELRPAPRRARVVEGDDEIALGRGTEAALDHLPGRQQVRERNRAEIVAERGAGPRRCRLQCRNTRENGEYDPTPFRPRLAIDQLENKAGEAIDAGIARGDQRDPATLGGKIEGATRSLHLGAERHGMSRLAGDRQAKEVEIEGVADDVAG